MRLYFDIRDLFQCVRLGWSGKKMWIGLLGLVAAWAGYSIFVLIAHVYEGHSGSMLWHRYGLFPAAKLGDFGFLGTGLHVIGMVWAVAVLYVTTMMMCKITFQHLRGDDFYSSGDAWQYAKKHWTGVLFGPIAILALFAFFVIDGILIGLIANWIPVVGELVFALSFIPIFFAALLAIFISVVLCASLLLSPAVVGSHGRDALEVVIQSFSMTWSQPWRLVLYSTWMKFSVSVGVAVLGTLTMAAIGLIVWACGLFMGDKLANLFDLASRYWFLEPKLWDQIFSPLPAVGTPLGSEVWSGRILGVMLVLVTGIVAAYAQAAYASGVTLIYVVLRYKRDGENILDEHDREVDDTSTTDVIESEDAEETEEIDPTDSEKA